MSAPAFRPRLVWIGIVILLIGASSVLAQPSDSDYSNVTRRLSPGDTVFITTHTEGEIRGRLVRMSPEAIVVAGDHGERSVASRDIGWIEKRGDPVWMGTLIGAGLFGFAMMGAAGASCSPDCGTQVPAAMALGIGVGAAAGALIDWMIPGRTLVYGKRSNDRTAVPGPPVATVPPKSRSAAASLWRQVAPGDRITVRTTGGAEINGRFARASDASVTVDVGKELREVSANEVTEVRRYRGGTHVKKGLFIGIPLGALSGTHFCYDVDDRHQQNNAGMPCGVGVLLGAAGGGAVGALLGRMTWGSNVIYTVAPVASAHSIGLMASFAF